MSLPSEANSSRRTPADMLLTRFAFLAICLETLFSVPYRTIHLATHSAPESWVAGLLGLALCAILYQCRKSIWQAAQVPFRHLPAASQSAWPAILTGLLLRLAWISCFHPPLTSDGLGYFKEATSLAQKHVSGGTYWPPGFPLFLAPFVALFGAHFWVADLCGLLLFAATVLLARKLTSALTGSRSAATLSGWILAIWPGYIAVVGINSKEALLACILTLALYVRYRSRQLTGGRAWLSIVATGLLIGFAALTQPGFTLFPAVLFLGDLLQSRRLLQSLVRTAVIAVAMYSTILPWTLHNYVVYHRFILISTNGGSVFYTANNAHANASYSEESQRALSPDPVKADEEGYRLGKQWVRQHPLAFAVLGIRKQVVFLGDDGIGIYETLKRDRQPSALLYNGLKAACSLYWMALWVVVLLGARRMFRAPAWLAYFSFAFLPFLYQWAIDSVFESGSRHHMAYVGCLAVLVSCASVAFRQETSQAATPWVEAGSKAAIQ